MHSQWAASIISGSANTPKARLETPSGWPSKPQWVIMASPRRFHSSRPASMGSRVTREVKIRGRLYCFNIGVLLRMPSGGEWCE